MRWWASPLNTRFGELNIEQLFFSIFNWQQTFFLVLVLMIRRCGKNLLMINQAGQWWSMRKQSLRQSVIERILGVAEFQGRNTDDMIFYGWSINYVTSQFHPDVKIMNFHWQRIIETHQCTRRWIWHYFSAINRVTMTNNRVMMTNIVWGHGLVAVMVNISSLLIARSKYLDLNIYHHSFKSTL